MGQPIPASDVEEQRASYTALLQNLGQATFEEVEAAGVCCWALFKDAAEREGSILGIKYLRPVGE